MQKSIGLISGDFFVRVVARNLAGLGETAEILVHLRGKPRFIFIEKNETFVIIRQSPV